jgi:hypothetical protein
MLMLPTRDDHGDMLSEDHNTDKRILVILVLLMQEENKQHCEHRYIIC